MRLYFRLQFTTKGDGFALALADGATNLAPNYWLRPQIMCGATDSASLGYAGSPSSTTPGIEKPKLGIEFDTLYSASRNDPPGDHMALVYWGTTTDTDGSDDNTHYLGNGGVAVTGATWAAGTATATTASPHGFAIGQVVLVSGLVPAGYNGTVTVTAIPVRHPVRYALTSNPARFHPRAKPRRYPPAAPRAIRASPPPCAMRRSPSSPADTFGGTGRRTTSWSFFSRRYRLSQRRIMACRRAIRLSYPAFPCRLQRHVQGDSALASTRPYRFRYSMASDPGVYVSGGTANKVTGAELSSLTWAARNRLCVHTLSRTDF
jgi:hypothetical protein